jgi:pilus assembly protein Flp/PilA
MRKFVSNFAKNDTGSNALEYGLIVGLVSLAIVAGATAAGTSLGAMFTALSTTIAGIAV